MSGSESARRRARVHAGLPLTGPHGGLRAPRSPVQHMCVYVCVSASVPVPGAEDIGGGVEGCLCVHLCVCALTHA